MVDQEERFRDLFDNATDLIQSVSPQGDFVFVNRAWRETLGYGEDEISGLSLFDVIDPDYRESYKKEFQRVLNGEKIDTIETVYLARDGRKIWLEGSLSARSVDGKAVAARGIFHNITDRKKAEDALRESEERYSLAMRAAMDGLWDWNLRTNRVFFSDRWKSTLGFTEDEIGEEPGEWLRRVHPEDAQRLIAEINDHLEGTTPHFECEHRIMHRDGSYRWVLARGLAVRAHGQKAHRIAGSLRDITGQKAAEERLRHEALHDPLSGLPNRVYFMEQLKRSVERAKRRMDYKFAVLFMDFDRFKFVNDSLGHAKGDQLLIAIARRLESCLRPGDVIARFGGDEFAILLEDIRVLIDATRVAVRVQSELSKPFDIQGHEVFITVSIGIALADAGYDKPEDMMRDADTAMYQAKANGRDRYEIFGAEMHARMVALLKTEAELRRSVVQKQFQVHYQPIISLPDGDITAVEARVMWQHPTRGLLPPSEFIALSEETGLIVPIGSFVLRTACAQVKAWDAAGYGQIRVGVNISARQLHRDQNLPGLVQQVLAENDLEARFLELEINETSALHNIDQTIEVLRELSSIGVRICMDNFGSRYSSLGYLRRIPADGIKIDRTFIHAIDSGHDGEVIVSAMIALAHVLGLNVIAVGVETHKQFEFLMAKQCDQIQGYLFSRSVPADALSALVARGRAKLPVDPGTQDQN